MSDCGRYLIVTPTSGSSGNENLYFADLEKNGPITGQISLTPVVTTLEASYDVNTYFTIISGN